MSKNTPLEILRLFNEKVARLERTRFYQRYKDTLPHVMADFKEVEITDLGEGRFNIFGRVVSWVPDFDQDEIDAFVLTFRMLTQRNDRISVARLNEIYQSPWMPAEARDAFEDARRKLNAYLESNTTVQIVTNHLSVRNLLDVTIYGGLAHTNPAKHRTFESWMKDGGMNGFIMVEFIVALKTSMDYFTYFRKLNEAVLEQASYE
jgi:hypothetical protein